MHQSYRNLSRHCKQYFYGDKKLEEIVILGLRSLFLIPLVSESLTDQIKHGGERRFADQIDRDFELVSYNTHPFQLFTYEVNNRFLPQENENYETSKAGQKTMEEEAMDLVDTLVKQEQAKYGEGEKIPIERMTEILYHVFDKSRAQMKRPSQDARGPDGNINDYLEQRRPFIAPTHESHTH